MTDSGKRRDRGLAESEAPWPDEKAGARETISLRATAAQKSVIDRAARIKGKSRTEFMLEAATGAAEDAICDQRLIQLDDADYRAFVRMLDEPAEPGPELARLMTKKALWET